MKYLAEHGCDAEAQNVLGKCGITIATELRFFDMLECLVGQGSDTYRADEIGLLHIHYAFYSGYVDVAKHFLGPGVTGKEVDVVSNV